MNGKEVLKYCPNFYEIINYTFEYEDAITEKLINIYKNFIFTANLNDEEEVELIKKIDSVLCKYIHDYIFRDTLKEKIIKVNVKKDSNILKSFVSSILNIFNDYEEYTTKIIYISRWI